METAIRSSGRTGQAEEWALVLAAAGIPHRVEPGGASWTLIVLDEDVVRACDALQDFDAEEATRGPIAASAERPVPWFLGVLAAALLLAGFAVIGSPAGASRWFERGAAVAGLMRAEPWRAVTALTLHLDVAHVAGNAIATAVLLPAIAQRLGGGVALCLVLLAGAAGNLLAALAHAPGHAAVGASTASLPPSGSWERCGSSLGPRWAGGGSRGRSRPPASCCSRCWEPPKGRTCSPTRPGFSVVRSQGLPLPASADRPAQ